MNIAIVGQAGTVGAESAREPARCRREATGSHALPLRGGLTNPVAWRGTVTFDAWLAS